MSRFKIMALIALFTFALGLALAGDAVAGEKMKGRCNWWTVKWEQIEVGDQEGHVFAIWEGKGIGANKEGKSFHDGWIEWSSSLNDQNLKTGVGTAHGYEIVTDPDGDKIFVSWEARWDPTTGKLKGTHDIVNGTGKWEGIRSKGTMAAHMVGQGQFVSDWEMDIEFPRR